MGGGYNPTQRSGAMSGSRWEADTLVVETHRHHLGHALTIVERLRLDGERTLVYKHEVTGPGNISDSREIRFDVEAANSL